MKNLIKLTDIVQIQPNSEFTKLSKTDKHKLMDSVLQSPAVDGKRGLLVDFNLSSSARRINNRIYTPKGQQSGVNSWIEPFPKPIIRNHDKNEDPLGRFVDVQWVSLDDQALPFFKNVNSFMDFKKTLDQNQPRKIYKALKQHGLLTNRKWPGLGALHARARITDEDAIEKFLDGRYMTFSAGSHTDAYVCGICDSDWAQGDICEHRPGQITEDGDIGVFVTGGFFGDEASVLNTPANDYSSVLSMEFSDSVELNNRVSLDSRGTDSSTIFMTDATVSSEMSTPSTIKLEDAMQPPEAQAMMLDMLGTLLGQYLLYYQAHWRTSGEPYYGDHLLFERLYEGIQCELDTMAEKILGYNGADTIDIVELNRLATTKLEEWTSTSSDFRQQGLASEEDMQASFKMHYDQLKEMDALPMGLDDFLMATAGKHDTHQYLLQQRTSMKTPKSTDTQTDNKSVEAEATQISDKEAKSEVAPGENEVDEVKVEKKVETQDETKKETTDVAPLEDAKKVEEPIKSEDASIEAPKLKDSGSDIDWGLLDLALDGELARLATEDTKFTDAQLTTEQRTKLESTDFCGPDRSFPVSDCAHVTAARRLVEKAKLSDSQKELVLAAVDSRAKAMECDSKDNCKKNCNCSTINKDYVEALKSIDALRVEVESLKQRLEDGTTDRDTITDVASVANSDIKQVDNPSVDSSDTNAPSASSEKARKGLPTFESKVLARYESILNTDGEARANSYISSKKAKGHIPKSFDPKQLMES